MTDQMKDMKSWIDTSENPDFSIYNFPFGVCKTKDNKTVNVSAIGSFAINLDELQQSGLLEEVELPADIFKNNSLNPFIKLGKKTTKQLRSRLIQLFSDETAELQNNEELKNKVLLPLTDIEMLLPVEIGDYTDFYSSIEHATNVGTMFRDPKNALMPNWKHIPVGYHGRASSIIVSGKDIYRPKGQTKADDQENPVFGPTKLLDFELEMAFITYQGKTLGESISTAEADDYIFGMVIFNDWSARDIQKWEYVPLGPFLAKNFASSVSPWIVTLDALEPFRTSGPIQEPEVLPYLKYEGDKNIDIKLEVAIQAEGQNPHVICNSNYKYMYWNMNQQLAHHTINGCNINAGDLYASGTISGHDKSSYGSMLELTWRGSQPIKMPDGSERKFINDGDTVIMKAHCQKESIRVGFGLVESKVLPAK